MFPTTFQPTVILSAAILLGVVAERVPLPRQTDMPQAPHPRVKPLTATEVEQFISRLGSEDYREREAATVVLKRRPEAALYLLRAAKSVDNPEVKQRLSAILPVMMSEDGANKRLACLPEYVKHRQLDRLVETMVACREFITAEHDVQVREFVKEIYTAATASCKLPPVYKLPEFGTFAWSNRPGSRIGEARGPTIVARIAPALKGRSTGIIASERIEGDGLAFGIALCNGDVRVHSSAFNVLIATGTVRVGLGGADAATIICLGDVDVDSGSGAVVVTAGRLSTDGRSDWRNSDTSIVREQDKDFFSTWKLYSATEAGATLWSAFGLVWVLGISPDTPFAKAGIKPGDILLAVDRIPSGSVHEANRLLCRATVSWGAADLSMLRNGKKRDVIVTLKEW